MKPYWTVVPLVFGLAVSESACQKKVAAPLPPVPAPAPAATPVPDTTQETTPPPANPPPVTPPSTPPSTPPATPPSVPPTRRPPRSPSAPAPATQPPLRLGDILTPEQQRQYSAAIDQALGRAQANLNAVANRQLTREQQATAAQVQNFIQQAQTTRRSDLIGAKSLAERADVLARDLAKSVR